MARSRHPKKEVEAALAHAEANGWRVSVGGAHAWGKIYCPYKGDECRCGTFCITSIWSTPKNAENHAKDLRKVVDNCTTHKKRQQPLQYAKSQPQPDPAANAAPGDDDGI